MRASMAESMTDLQAMLQHELSRFQKRGSSDVRIDPDASATGDSFNHSTADDLYYRAEDPDCSHLLVGSTGGGAKRSRSSRRGKVKNSQQRSSQLRSSCADEIIAEALSNGINGQRTSRSSEPREKLHRQRKQNSGLHTESLGPAPIHIDPSRECADLLGEWCGSYSQRQELRGTENASAQLNSIEKMLDESVVERENMSHKQEHQAQMQRLRAIEQDWSTINDMRHDFESTKAKLKTLMHRELAPESQFPDTSTHILRTNHADHASQKRNPQCNPVDSMQPIKHPHRRQMRGTDTLQDMAVDVRQSCKGIDLDDGSSTVGIVAAECAKPYSQWQRYEQRLRAREAEAEAAELRSQVELLKKQLSAHTGMVNKGPAVSEPKPKQPLQSSKKESKGASTEMDALYSAVVETRSTMLDTLRRVQWSPGSTPAVASLQERLDTQCVHGTPAEKHCTADSSSDPVQLSHGMLVQAKELLQTLVDHVESDQGKHSGKTDPDLTSDVQALQDHLAELTQEYTQIRDNLSAERCMRRDAEKALAAAAADAAEANTAPVQGLLDALHAARAEANATKNHNRELRQQLAGLGHEACSAGAAATRRSQSLSPEVPLGAVGRRGGGTGGGAFDAAEAEIAARDEALADAVQEAAELRRQLRTANAARGEVECLEREIAGLTHDAELGAAAQRDVTRLEREVGDLKWKLECATEEQQEVQLLKEELKTLKDSPKETTREGSGTLEATEAVVERLKVTEMALEKELAEKNRLEKEVQRWKGSDGKELERLRNEMAALEKVKEDSVLDLRRLELKHADVVQQLEESTQALDAESVARKHADQSIRKLSDRIQTSSVRTSLSEREASLWGGLAGAPTDRVENPQTMLSVPGSNEGSVVCVEGAEREVERVERELAHAKARVRELRSRENSQQHSAPGGVFGGSRQWDTLLESPDSGQKGRNVLLDNSCRDSEDLAARRTGSSAALRDLESRVTRLEKERVTATAQLDLARSLQGHNEMHDGALQHSARSSYMHGGIDDTSAQHSGHGPAGLLDAFACDAADDCVTASPSDSGDLLDLAGSLSSIEEEIAAALGYRDIGEVPGGANMQQRLRNLAATVQQKLMSASVRLQRARAAAASSDTRATALIEQLRAAGVSDGTAALPVLREQDMTENRRKLGSEQLLDELKSELEDAQQEIARLRVSLQDALQREEEQAAELASLHGAVAGGVDARGICAPSPETSAGSTPLISAWTPSSAGAALAADGAVCTHSPYHGGGDQPAVLNSTADRGLAGDDGDSCSESSLRTGATVAAVLALDGSGERLEAALRLGSQATFTPRQGITSALPCGTSQGEDDAHAQSTTAQVNVIMRGTAHSSGGAHADGSDRGGRTSSGLLGQLLSVANCGQTDGPLQGSVAVAREAGKAKHTFVGVDLSDIDASSTGAPGSTRQSSPIRSQAAIGGDKITSRDASQQDSATAGADMSPRDSAQHAALDFTHATVAPPCSDSRNPLLSEASRSDDSARHSSSHSARYAGDESSTPEQLVAAAAGATGGTKSNILSLPAAQHRATADSASDRSQPSTASMRGSQSPLDTAQVAAQGSSELEPNMAPFEMGPSHAGHSGQLSVVDESSRTAAEASISHMASRPVGHDRVPGAALAGTLTQASHDAAHRLSSTSDTARTQSTATATPHEPAELATLCSAVPSSSHSQQQPQNQSMHSGLVPGQSGDGGDSDTASAYSRLERVGQATEGFSDLRRSTLGSDHPARHSDAQGGAANSMRAHSGPDARLDLSAFGPDTASGAGQDTTADDPITAMTRRSLRKLEQQEAEDERRRSLSPLRVRSRSSIKSNTPSVVQDPSATHVSTLHASTANMVQSAARGRSPSALLRPPFEVPAARSQSPPLSPTALSTAGRNVSPEVRTGDWVAVSSKYTHSGNSQVLGADDAQDRTHAVHAVRAGGAPLDQHADSRQNRQQRSRSPAMRNSAADGRASPPGHALLPFSTRSEPAVSSGPNTDLPGNTRTSMHATHASCPLSENLKVPPSTSAHGARIEQDSGPKANSGTPEADATTKNPLEKLRQRLEVWRASPIPASGKQDNVPMSPPQFPPAQTVSCGGSWSASEQLGRPPTGRGSVTGTNLSGLGFSQSHRGPFSALHGDEHMHRTRSMSGNFPEASAGASSVDCATSRAPAATDLSEADQKILDGSGTPLSAWHASQNRTVCPDEQEQAGETEEDACDRWTKIPELLTKYGGPGRLVGHCEVFSDDGEPEERDAPALRPGAHSPTAGIRHMAATVMQLEDARVAAASGAAAPPRSSPAARMSMSVPGGAWGSAWMDSDVDDSRPGAGSWTSMGGFDGDAWSTRGRSGTSTADLARRLAEVRAGTRH